MQTSFAPAFEFLLDHEDPKRSGVVTRDSGGLTKWGISQKAYPHLDIRNLRIEDAANIYRDDYWKPIRGYDIQDQDVANKLLDMAVNMGVGSAVRICQKACCALGQLVSVDGSFGPNTLEAVNRCDAEALLGMLRAECKAHYAEIAEANPDLAQYLNGWMARANS